MDGRIRKQVYELTQDDLHVFPVWEFCLDEEGEDGQDEATVRPYQMQGPINPSVGMFVVRAAFSLADGSKLNGYLTPGVQGDYSISTVQPIIITDAGQVGFWCGCAVPDRATVAKSYGALGKQGPTAVFPLRFESQVELLDGCVRGVLTGFMYYSDWQSEEVGETT